MTACVYEPNMAQASFYYGFNNLFTGYTGVQITDNDYMSGLLGLGINTSIGAFAVDYYTCPYRNS